MYTEMTDEYSFCRPYLTAGETVLWRGKPGKGHLLTGQDIFMIPFSILWCGFAIFWEATVIRNGAPFFFTLWGIPFVCVGLYMVFGRFLWTAWIRKRTAYVITDQKILRARGNRVDMLSPQCTLPPTGTAAAPYGLENTVPGAETRTRLPLPWKTWRTWRGSRGSFWECDKSKL